MLRLLTQTVSALWNERPADTYAIHLNHMNPGYGPIRNEIVTRLEFANFDPAIRVDVDSGGGDWILRPSGESAGFTGHVACDYSVLLMGSNSVRPSLNRVHGRGVIRTGRHRQVITISWLLLT